ncbi:hypothetical protein D3C71_1967260 [compost metagenome]
MPCSLRNAVSLLFCRYGLSSIWLVAISPLPTTSMAWRVSSMLKLDTPIWRVRPSSLASARAAMYSRSSTPLPGAGQWISSRST